MIRIITSTLAPPGQKEARNEPKEKGGNAGSGHCHGELLCAVPPPWVWLLHMYAWTHLQFDNVVKVEVYLFYHLSFFSTWVGWRMDKILPSIFELFNDDTGLTITALSVSAHSDILEELGSILWVEAVMADTLGRHNVPTTVRILQLHTGRAGGGHCAAGQGQRQDLIPGRHHQPPLRLFTLHLKAWVWFLVGGEGEVKKRNMSSFKIMRNKGSTLTTH